MSRLRDQLTPVLAGALVVIVGVGVVLLLRSASDQGVRALRRAKLAQVQVTADSFNTRVSTALESASGLSGAGWQLTPNSAADTRKLRTYNVDANAKSGMFVINADDTVTAGVLLEPGRLGSRFAPAGWAAAKRKLSRQDAVVLPVSEDGLTTNLPSYDFVIAIRGATSDVRGALVVESALTNDSPFQKEILQLGQHAASSAGWFFIDSRGSVVATTTDATLGGPIENRRYLTIAPGLTDIGSKIVITAPVPALGWRVVFREKRSQFESALSDPIQRAGLILVLLLLAVGLTLVVLLIRRLRAAREQERRLRELSRSQAEFISVVSHELRTPVAGVLGFLQTTVDHWNDLSDDERLTTVRRAITNARRLQAMTRDVLDTESIESGRLGYAFQRIDLGAELETAIEGTVQADSSHVVQYAAPSSPVYVNADPDRLQQVLNNLLENARRNAPPTEPIVITTEIATGAAPKVRVSVIDKGAGIDSDSLERIFDKFVRGSDNAVSGTGLGLYIVRQIIEAHQGRIWCESTPGVRTAFIFELPLAPTPEPVVSTR